MTPNLRGTLIFAMALLDIEEELSAVPIESESPMRVSHDQRKAAHE